MIKYSCNISDEPLRGNIVDFSKDLTISCFPHKIHEIKIQVGEDRAGVLQGILEQRASSKEAAAICDEPQQIYGMSIFGRVP